MPRGCEGLENPLTSPGLSVHLERRGIKDEPASEWAAFSQRRYVKWPAYAGTTMLTSFLLQCAPNPGGTEALQV